MSPRSQPRIMVAVASRHKATAEIGSRIAEVMNRSDVDASFTLLDDSTVTGDFDAFVVGSAVYAGRWLPEARDFVKQHKQELAGKPVFLFSCGPVGEEPLPHEDPFDIERMSLLSTARDHRIFGGRLDHTKLGMLERGIVMALGAPEGDYRPWADIDAWADNIAATLIDESAGSPRGQSTH